MAIRNTALLCASAAGLALSSTPVWAEGQTPSLEKMWQIIQEQQATISKLKEALETTREETTRTQDSVEKTQKNVEAVANAVENKASSAGTGWWNRTSLGGYGEMHYQGGAKDQLDFHRFVLFFGHEFNDNIRFASELELEHAFSADGEPGEVELEQAYIEADLNESTQIYGGVHLVPVGLINEGHEPPTFYGVERNAVEKNIIPATWWEGGLGMRGAIGDSGFSYDAMVSSGLELNAANGYKVRSGRQKVAEANFKNQAYTGRLSYSGIPGIKMAGSVYYQSDATQGAGDALTGKGVSALLLTANVDAKWRGFGMRALYANWSLDGAEVDLTGRDKQVGYYVEPSYKFSLPLGAFDTAQLGVFYRYSNWDNNKGLRGNTGINRHIFGANFWPVEDVVLKMDYIIEDRESTIRNLKSLNLGIGYQF
ncbi:MAG: porin [Robiginitomaculum sp.]|nr:MAG: porin [Robiginitomaculum sp.]